MKPSFLDLVKISNSGQKVPVASLVRDNPKLAAVASKLLQGPDRAEHTSDGKRKITAPDEHRLNQLSISVARNARENKSLMQMLPDMELGFQILISVCCAPKDMVTLELIFESNLRNLNPSMTSKLIQEIRGHFDNTYKIKNKIPEILRDIFQVTGSHILAVLPENSIDELINRHGSVSMEEYNSVISSPEFNSEMGFLGGGQGTVKPTTTQKISTLTSAVENHSFFDIDAKTVVQNKRCMVLMDSSGNPSEFSEVTITDNPNVLRNTALLKSLRRGVVENRMGTNGIKPGLENFRTGRGEVKINDRVLTDLIYKPRKSTHKQMEILLTQNQLKRSSVGEPLIMQLPSESVVPVVTPGDERRHVGYFILLDETGNPVRSDTTRDGYGMLAQRMMASDSQNSAMLQRLTNLNQGIQCANYLDAQRATRVYTDLVEQDWLASLQNGMYANGVALAKVEDMYRILLARKLQNQRSTVLFLPVEAVTYFALRYNESGIGVSLLDEMKIINSQRAVLMFANTMSGIMNSMNRTLVDIKLDENDPDPQERIEQVMDTLVRTNTTMFPLGIDSPSDIVSYLQKSQFEFKYSGHPGMPDMSIDMSTKQGDHNKVDTELEEQLRKYAYATIGLTLEHVDNGFNQQTATSVVAENLMLSRRVLTIQDQFNPHLTDHVTKVVRASQPLCDQLREVISSNLDSLKLDIPAIQQQLGDGVDATKAIVERVLSDFVNALEVSLPKPNMATLANQKKALEDYDQFLEIGLNSYISSDYFSSDMLGVLGDSVDASKKVLKAYFMRKFMADNGILTELADLTNVDEDGEANTHIYAHVEDHLKKLMKTSGGLLQKINHDKMKSNELMEKLAVSADNTSSSFDGGGDDSGSDDSGGFDDFGGDGGGSDDPFAPPDMDMSFSTPGDDSAPDADAPAEETPPAA